MLAGESKWANGGGRNDAGTETSGYQYVGRAVRSESAPTHDPKTCHRAGNGGETRENGQSYLRLAARDKPAVCVSAPENRRNFKSFQCKEFDSGIGLSIDARRIPYVALYRRETIIHTSQLRYWYDEPKPKTHSIHTGDPWA